MRRFSTASLVFFLCTVTADAQIRQFPYDAVVETDGVYIRSGPGEKYYPTTRLPQGRRVKVQRHDPGGWYMISPPEESFSWIPARHVRKTGGRAAEVTQDQVVVYVGSDFGDEASVFQRRLSIGEPVEIIGESTITTGAGSEKMYQIKPPRREWRWIPGHAVVPAEAGLREQNDRDPYATPSGARRDPVVEEREERPRLNPRPQQRRSADTGNLRINPDELKQDRDRLDQLDARFRMIIQRPTSDWSFAELEDAYRELQRDASHPAMANQIELRYPALKRYQRMKQRYDEFASLTAATDKRDAELLRMRGTGTVPLPTPDPVTDTGSAESQTPGTDTVDGMRRVPTRHPRFAGAGVVQRSAGEPGVPEYVLLTPRGRILAYLEGVDGYDLATVVGQSLGIIGERFHRADIAADFIRVRETSPVRLRQDR